MANSIEELFYNNINPQVRMVRNGSNFQKQMEILADCEERLTNKLTDDDKKAFLAFVNAVGEVQGESQLDSFIIGFRLGARFAFDTFVGNQAPYCDLTED